MAMNFQYRNLNSELLKATPTSTGYTPINSYKNKIFHNPLVKWEFKNKKYFLSTVLINGNYETRVLFQNKIIFEEINNIEIEAKKTFNNLKSRFFKTRPLLFKVILIIRKLKFIKNRNKTILEKFLRRSNML